MKQLGDQRQEGVACNFGTHRRSYKQSNVNGNTIKCETIFANKIEAQSTPAQILRSSNGLKHIQNAPMKLR